MLWFKAEKVNLFLSSLSAIIKTFLDMLVVVFSK